MILIRDLDYRYHLEQPWIFKNFNVHWTGGKVVHLIGPNGSGKSTLLKLITSLLKPIHGKIECQNRFYFINQSTDLNIFLTVLEQFISQLFFSGFNLDDLSMFDPRQILLEWGFQEQTLSQSIRDLSVGQKRRLSLAILSVFLKYITLQSQQGIPIWLLDEPDSNLDILGQQKLVQIIQNFISNPSHLVVFTSHQQDWVVSLKQACRHQWVSIQL